MSYKVVLPCFLTLILSSCGPTVDSQVRQQPIIAGQDCDAAAMPATVGLIADAKLVFLGIQLPFRAISCTGTLIAPDTVLTAAHCVHPEMLSGGLGVAKDEAFHISFEPDLTGLVPDPKALPGGKLPDLPQDAHKAGAWIHHPGFSPAALAAFKGGLINLHDVALVFLEQPVQTVKPAVLITRTEAEQIAVGQQVQMAGWGTNMVLPNNPFIPAPAGSSGIKKCSTSFINEVGSHEMQIGYYRAGRKCHGDSGGPTYMTVSTSHKRTERVVGITSHAYDISGMCKTGGVDTRVDAWLDWIDQQMTLACRDGRRSWCQVEGIVPPSFYDSQQDGKLEPDFDLPPDASPPGDAEVTKDTAAPVADAVAPDVNEDDGCGCRVARHPLQGWPVWFVLMGLTLAMRRLRRR